MEAIMLWDDDWSGGWARRRPDGAPETWGEFYAAGHGVVRLYRGKYNRCRFYDRHGCQVEGEQSNVYPAIAGALEVMGWAAL